MPAIINNYNSYMGGVDLLDSYLAKYIFLMRSRRWYMYIFWHSIMIAMVNAWLVYRRDSRALGALDKEILNRRKFQAIIANSLTQTNAVRRRGRPSAAGDTVECGQILHKRAKTAPCDDVRKDTYGHWPIPVDKRGRCKLCIEGQSSIQCEKCDVRLCLNKGRNCFKQFHM
ncbi:piggyBac transposable element-derived protein 2-like [Watersipora subatra]|uniref:piggyBac transposable element-derived protein 2-like n=1 Tax=Watersipora subatra TaxID=2589382 RepID=UPI00355BB16F